MRDGLAAEGAQGALTGATIPELDYEFITRFTAERCRVHTVGSFNPTAALAAINRQVGKEVLGVDIGGDKIEVNRMIVRPGGALDAVTKFRSERSRDGANYLPVLEAAASTARTEGLGAGISYPAAVTEQGPSPSLKLPQLLTDLEVYDGNFTQSDDGERILFGQSLKALDNDAISGLKAAGLEIFKRNPALQNIIYLIMGSGMGGAVLLKDQIVAAEPGHVPVADVFNPLQRNDPCIEFGQKETCISRVAAGKIGIEATWQEQTGDTLTALEIEELALGHDGLALLLYENSARLAAHAIYGLAHANGIQLETGDTAVVLHGGIFKFTDYAHRVQQIVGKNDPQIPVLCTHDFSENACLDGAAIAVLANDAE